jgi:hypothetical protein
VVFNTGFTVNALSGVFVEWSICKEIEILKWRNKIYTVVIDLLMDQEIVLLNSGHE